MPKLVALPVRGYPDIYVNPTRVTLIREGGEAETDTGRIRGRQARSNRPSHREGSRVDRSGIVEYGGDPRSPLMRLVGRRRPAPLYGGAFFPLRVPI
jgi:hypothetical protein